ncbi:MAG: adenylosuccinate synthetase [Christensenellaceae bacterium]|jgi:adenylosuccinate synthase|nr:adenylosuccinate synthetase [Christensenellaceae bacterium]
MANIAVVGGQSGDEGKGKMVDYFATRENTGAVVRFQGGSNAGHTVKNEFGQFPLHSIPSGIFTRGVKNVLGMNVAVDPNQLFNIEIPDIKRRNPNVKISPENLMISNLAHVLLPQDIMIDSAKEIKNGRGSTKSGIWPAYAAASARMDLRVEDLTTYWDEKRIREIYEDKNRQLNSFGLPNYDWDKFLSELYEYGEQLRPHVANVNKLLTDVEKSGKDILFEAQLGTFKDRDYGDIPNASSTNNIGASAPVQAGAPKIKLTKTIGVIKAYLTNVGQGNVITPMPSEISKVVAERGYEYGAKTGRPRECHWLDLVAAKYACDLGIDSLAVMKADVLNDLPYINVCNGYKLPNGTVINVGELESIKQIGDATPIYKTFDSWEGDISTARDWNDLPDNAKRLYGFIEEKTQTPIEYISVGPERDQTIEMGKQN